MSLEVMGVNSFSDMMHGVKPALMMVVVQVVFAGVNILYKLAASDGMSLQVIVAYRFIFAAVFMIPLALLVERKSRSKLTWTVVFQAFLCGLFGGSLSQNLYLKSLTLTSATFASAIANLVPAITFILSVCFRLEELEIKTRSGMAKVLGTLIGIGGAMVLTFYKGVDINISSNHIDLLHHHNATQVSSSSSHHSFQHLLGLLLALASCFSYATWLIIQTKMVKRYPYHYSSTALTCLMGAIQATIYALFTETNKSQWKLGWNIRILTVAYSGIGASGLMVTLIAYVVKRRGPLFASVFNPLMLVVVAFVGSFILDEKLHFGSIIGSILIVCGLYFVLWGKGKEMKKKISQVVPSSSSNKESIEIVVITSPVDNNINVINNHGQDISEALKVDETLEKSEV